jgi:hypothetical protein
VSAAPFDVDPDIRVARTLPARVESYPETFRLQRERVFPRTHFHRLLAEFVSSSSRDPWGGLT